MEQVTCKENEIDVVISSELQYFPKSVDRVLSSDRIFLRISYVVVCSDENTKTTDNRMLDFRRRSGKPYSYFSKSINAHVRDTKARLDLKSLPGSTILGGGSSPISLLVTNVRLIFHISKEVDTLVVSRVRDWGPTLSLKPYFFA